MRVRDAMSTTLVSVGPDHTLQQAAEAMVAHGVGSALVLDLDGEGPGILTERDVLRAVAAGEDPAVTRVADHHVDDVVVAAPDWDLDRAARAMIGGGFRHLVVVDQAGEVLGMVSMRDIVRCQVSASA